MEIIEQLKRYTPINEQEQIDKQVIISQIENNNDIFYRTNLTQHISVSGWIINKTRDKVLMCFHNIYKSYSWLGGHADGDTNLKRVILKEVEEESGLKNIKILTDDIFSLEILCVNGHVKKGKYVPSHLHLNITYLIEADSNGKLKIKEDENSDLKWFSIDNVVSSSNEEWMKERIYSKLNSKLKMYIENKII